MEKLTVDFKTTKISYTDSGKGSAIVLLHGFLENSTMWDFFIPHLAAKNRVITIDLLGHGASESRGYIHSMEDNAQIVHAVLAELRIRKCIIIGHSMGGYVALAFAELFPDFVKAIILLNSTSRADSDEKKANRDRAIKAVKHNHKNFVSLSIANLFSEDNREKLAAEIEHTKQQALKTPLQGIVATLEGMKIRKDREVLLHFGSFPILMILGKQDPVLKYDDAITQIEESRVELITFPDGHMSTIENRDDLLLEIQSFLKKIK